MTRLSDVQIATVARGAGFTGNDVAIAVAVCLAESGGRTDALSPPNHDGTYDHGLWQINSVHASLLASGAWSNPNDNARMAYAVFHGAGNRWTPWTTYNSGAYFAYYARGRVAASAVGGVASSAGSAAGVAFSNTPKHSGPYAVRPNENLSKGKNVEWSGSHDLRVAGKWYAAVDYFPQTHSNINNQYPRAKMVPVAAVTVIAKYLKKTLPNDAAAQNAAVIWLEPGGHAQPNAAGNVLASYCDYINPISAGKNPDGGLPGEIGNKVIDSATALADLVKFITDPHNWQRLAFFLVGALLILFAAYKLADIPTPSVGTIAKAAAL